VPRTISRDYLVRDERLSPDERRVERGGERSGPDPCKDGTAAGMMKMAHETTPFEGVSRAPASTGGLLQLPVTERIASRIISTTVPGAVTLGV
jgi:hypothetical protein